MADNSRVVWKEGLFIRPHHFQQESRYVDYLLTQRMHQVCEFLFGFQSLVINQEYLKYGKLGVESASGTMPDGTVFNIPEETPAPKPLSITTSDMINQVVYLCLPLKSKGADDLSLSDTKASARLVGGEVEVKDTFSGGNNYASLEVAKVNVCLMLENEDRSSYNSIAVARVVDLQADGSIGLDQQFFPTSLSIAAIPQLKKFLEEISGMMRERSKNLSERVGNPSQAGVADVTDFMMLLALNRLAPYFSHLSSLHHLHPERLYASLICACSELATFISEDKQVELFSAYQHTLLHQCFIPVIRRLQEVLGTVMQPKAIPLMVKFQGKNIYSALLADSDLVNSADFILAVKASEPAEQLAEQFPNKAKVAPLEDLSKFIHLQLPGIRLQPLPVAPRYLPYHAGFVYFQLQKTGDVWTGMSNASGFGFHVAGSYKDLEIEFWAIRADA